MAIVASHVYNTLLDIIRADKRGLTLSVDEFNRVARLVNQRIYDKFYDEFETSTANTDSMAGFKVFNTTVALVAGVGSLPSDYYEMIGRPHYVDANSVTRYFDLVSNLELAQRQTDYLTQPSLTHPVCVIGETDGSGNLEIHVYPTSIASIDIDYLREPDIPFLDYYVNNTTLNYTFLTDGAGIVAVPSGSTYRDGQTGAVNVLSTTVDWEWGDGEFSLIMALFCQYVGITLPDQYMLETGLVKEEKS